MEDRTLTIHPSANSGNEGNHFFKQPSLSSRDLLIDLKAINANLAIATAQHRKQSKDLKEDITTLNHALANEYQMIAAYQVGIESNLLQKLILDSVVKFQSHHKVRAALLQSAVIRQGGKPVDPKKPHEYGFPVEKLKNQRRILTFVASLEHNASIACLTIASKFHSYDLATAAVSILNDESIAWTMLLILLDEDVLPGAV